MNPSILFSFLQLIYLCSSTITRCTFVCVLAGLRAESSLNSISLLVSPESEESVSVGCRGTIATAMLCWDCITGAAKTIWFSASCLFDTYINTHIHTYICHGKGTVGVSCLLISSSDQRIDLCVERTIRKAHITTRPSSLC